MVLLLYKVHQVVIIVEIEERHELLGMIRCSVIVRGGKHWRTKALFEDKETKRKSDEHADNSNL